MGFNWGVFIAQIVNLFVLIWLMKRFLYQPIISVVEKRQAYINDKVKNAEDMAKAAQKQQIELEKKIDRWNVEKQSRQEDLFAALTKMKAEQEAQIDREGEQHRQALQKNLNRETASLQVEIRDLMAHNFMDMSRKVLSDMSGLSPMKQAITLFEKKVDSLSKKEITSIKNTFNKQNVVIVRSSVALSDKEAETIVNFLAKKFSFIDAGAIQFTVAPDLILGLELEIGETVLEWNLKTYLDTFESNLNAALAGLIINKE